MIVKFNATEEYINELDKNVSKVKNDLLRVTQRAQFTNTSRRLFITATYVVGDDIIRLDRYVGDLTGEQKTDKAIYRKADAIINTIENAAKKVGIEPRAGLYE